MSRIVSVTPRRRTLIPQGDKARRAPAILPQTDSNFEVHKAAQARKKASARAGRAWASSRFLQAAMIGASSKPVLALRIRATGMRSYLSGTTPRLEDETASLSVWRGAREKAPPLARAEGEAQSTRSIEATRLREFVRQYVRSKTRFSVTHS